MLKVKTEWCCYHAVEKLCAVSGTENAQLLQTVGDSHVSHATQASDPSHTPSQLHSFLIPLPHMPFKCVSSRMVVRGRWGSEAIRCHFERKKGSKKEIGWKLYITLFSLNCTMVKTVWPLSALPAVEQPFLSSPESYVNGTLLSALFLWNWFLLYVVLDEYFHGFLCSSWILGIIE